MDLAVDSVVFCSPICERLEKSAATCSWPSEDDCRTQDKLELFD